MSNEFNIHTIDQFPFKEFYNLKELSEGEGFRFLGRLEDEWEKGVNRFDKKFEALYRVCFAKTSETIAIGGINANLYPSEARVKSGRLRRFYVKPIWRRKGVGNLLLSHILKENGKAFDVIYLNTDSEKASKFYEKNGFVRILSIPKCTHKLVMQDY